MRYFELLKEYKTKDNKGIPFNENIIMERTYEEWLALIARLEAYANTADRSVEERELYRQKAEELRKKVEQEFVGQKKFKDILPDFKKGEKGVSYTKTGEFKPYPFKTGSKVDVRT